MTNRHTVRYAIGSTTVVFLLSITSVWAADGKAIFTNDTNKCNKCHTVKSAGIEKDGAGGSAKAPDLSGVGTKHADTEWIKKYITKQEIDGVKKHMKQAKGSAKEITALVTWLGSLK